MLATHSQRLERWLGAEKVSEISRAMLAWPGPPIAIAGVPGAVWAMPGGDFRGRIAAGQFAPVADFVASRLRRIMRGAARRQRAQCNAGFASLADLVAEASAGKRQVVPFQKTGSNQPTLGGSVSSWYASPLPAAGGNASAAPGGRACTSATTGALWFDNADSGDTLHFVKGEIRCDKAINTLLLYDRLFDVSKTMNSTATEAVSGAPSRYQSTSPSAQDYAGGNFLFVECQTGTGLSATAHNWTTCLYTDQDGNTGVTLPSLAGVSGQFGWNFDHPVGQWFAPLASGDSGILALTQMQCSALVTTGGVNFVMGHPIAFMPNLLANILCTIDGLLSAFNLTRIFDDACLAFIEVCRGASTTPTYAGALTLVAG